MNNFSDSSTNILLDLKFLQTLATFNLVVGPSFHHNFGLFTMCERQKGHEILRFQVTPPSCASPKCSNQPPRPSLRPAYRPPAECARPPDASSARPPAAAAASVVQALMLQLSEVHDTKIAFRRYASPTPPARWICACMPYRAPRPPASRPDLDAAVAVGSSRQT